MALQPSIRVINGRVFGAYAAQAKNVAYNNTDSGLTATDVQGAVDEVVNKLNLKAVRKEFTNLTLNANKEINLGPASNFLPDGVSGNIILFEVCSAATGTGPLRVEGGLYLAASNVWLIGSVANQTISNIAIRALYYEN